MERRYLSEISSWWSIERQEAALGDLPSGAIVFIDRLDTRQRRAHQSASLLQRTECLRPTKRPARDEVIRVASPDVLAWSEEDIQAVLAAVAARGARLVAAEGSPVEDNPAAWVAAWSAARKRSRLEGAQLRGAAVSAARRSAVALAGVNRIKARWPLPSKQHSTAALILEAGVSLNTAVKHLGRRPLAQHTRAIAEKAKATRARRKEAQIDG